MNWPFKIVRWFDHMGWLLKFDDMGWLLKLVDCGARREVQHNILISVEPKKAICDFLFYV